MLAELKTLANKKDVPYQSLAKIYLDRQISLERGSFPTTPKKRRRKADAQQVTGADSWKAKAFQKRLSSNVPATRSGRIIERDPKELFPQYKNSRISYAMVILEIAQKPKLHNPA